MTGRGGPTGRRRSRCSLPNTSDGSSRRTPVRVISPRYPLNRCLPTRVIVESISACGSMERRKSVVPVSRPATSMIVDGWFRSRSRGRQSSNSQPAVVRSLPPPCAATTPAVKRRRASPEASVSAIAFMVVRHPSRSASREPMEGSTVLYLSIDSASKVTVVSTLAAERRRPGRERRLVGDRCVHGSPVCHTCTPLSPARTNPPIVSHRRTGR